ncbi:uncharacterized protein LOC135499405 [Lineus longissimus]|uniref:uncharacterized protein LOC135499405 n=1 Tax=Lineus longissimus TaxID=88925 RepID=UPI00315CBDB6
MGLTATSELEEFLGIDKIGLQPKYCKCEAERENQHANENTKQSLTQLEDGTYQVSLPWRKLPTGLPNNYDYDYAVKRFLNLKKQLKKKPREWVVYAKQMEDQLKRGVARRVPAAEFEQDMKDGHGMWFLPHFAEDSVTTPVRVVYVSKARYLGHSLNDYLAKGDVVSPSIFDIGLRFREYEVGVVADISKMFQAVELNKEDARYHRYVYRANPGELITVYELTTVTFGDKSSPAAAVLALRHVAQEHASENPEIQRVITDQFYMDDLNDSQRAEDSVQQLKADLTGTLGKGKLNIRKWLSNKPTVCDPEYIPSNGETTVLGTTWNIEKDTLSVKKVESKDIFPTKRKILSKTASYYDVFGMLSGIIVRPKMLLQKMWRFDLGWDTPISPESDLFTELKAL